MLRNLAVAPASIVLPAAPVAGMLAWYAADRITSPPASGSALGSWNDLSGNGYTASQATGADQPTYNTNVQNGLPAVSFNGTSDYMLATIASTSQPVTIFVALNSGSPTGNRAIWGSSNPLCYLDGSGDIILTAGVGITGAITSNTWHYVTTLLNTTSSVIRVDGAAVASGSGGAGNVGATLYLGTYQGSSDFFNAPIGEMIVYTSALTTPQMQQTERYLSGKWGIGAGGGTQQTAASAVFAQAGAVGRSSVI